MKQNKSIYAVIGIGSNIDAKRNIARAIDELNLLAEVIQLSEVLITKPIGIIDQDDFLNAVALIRVQLSYELLNQELKGLEDKLGRDRTRPKFGPREIDLDIVVYDDEITDDDFYTRDFLQALVGQVWQKK